MERHLTDHEWFVGATYSIADIALYAYTDVAGEGGFDLAPFPAIRRWLSHVAAEPNHMPITDAGVGTRSAKRETHSDVILYDENANDSHLHLVRSGRSN